MLTFLLLLHTQVFVTPLTKLHGIFEDYGLLNRSCKIIRLVYLTELFLLKLLGLHFIPQSWIYVSLCFIFSITNFYTLVTAYCQLCREWPTVHHFWSNIAQTSSETVIWFHFISLHILHRHHIILKIERHHFWSNIGQTSSETVIWFHFVSLHILHRHHIISKIQRHHFWSNIAQISSQTVIWFHFVSLCILQRHHLS